MSGLEHMHADNVLQHEACCVYAGERTHSRSFVSLRLSVQLLPQLLAEELSASEILRVWFVPWDQDHTIVDYVKDKVAGAFGTAEDTSESAAAQAAAAKEAVHKCGCTCYSC